MLNMQYIYWKEPTKLNLPKKKIKIKIEQKLTDLQCTVFLELIFAKKCVSERSSDFTIIRKFVFAS